MQYVGSTPTLSTMKKKYDSMKVHGSLQREEEIKNHGKLISLRPSVSHKSKKIYSRKLNKNLDM